MHPINHGTSSLLWSKIRGGIWCKALPRRTRGTPSGTISSLRPPRPISGRLHSRIATTCWPCGVLDIKHFILLYHSSCFPDHRAIFGVFSTVLKRHSFKIFYIERYYYFLFKFALFFIVVYEKNMAGFAFFFCNSGMRKPAPQKEEEGHK
jgi:hypothetical protein